MTPAEVLAHLARRLPGIDARAAERLSGGLLNETWRVHTTSGSVVVKHAPPFIATAPEVPLDPSRLAFETRALAALAPGGRLAAVAGPTARPPKPLDFDPTASILVMEDVGAAPHLTEALGRGADGAALGRVLGRFVGRLHAASTGDPAVARSFANLPIQRTRHEVQYRAVGPLLRAAGVADADTLGDAAVDLGTRLQAPGRCLVMGDLWPPSVLVTAAGVRLVDWEFCHFGSPAQDLGHLAAHLWMTAHRRPGPGVATACRATWPAFLEAYLDALGAAGGSLLDRTVRRDAALHAGAEILIRVVGAFRAGFLYDGLAPDSPEVASAVGVAADRLRTRPGAAEFSDLV